VLVVLAWRLGVGAAQAQASLQPIERAVPDAWRPPLARFLQELGAANVESILDNTTGGPIGQSDAVLVRFEDQDLCTQGSCLTAIGTIRSDGFFPQTMFMGGKWIARRDSMGQLLGRLIPPPFSLCVSERPGERDCLTLYETPKGWIVSPLAK
jgi:hypothetical protein